MKLRTALAVIGLIELIAPRRFLNLWIRLCFTNPDEVEVRSWVPTAVRLEGLALVAWVAWTRREQLEEYADAASLVRETQPPEIEVAPEDAPSLRPGTTRFDLAAALYQADEPVAVSELVSRSEETEWEVGRSSASATLYRMHRDGLVDRREREEGRGYEYWISDRGRSLLEEGDGPIEPGVSPTVE